MLDKTNLYSQLERARQDLKTLLSEKSTMLAQQKCALAFSYLGPTPLEGSELACFATIKCLEIFVSDLERVLENLAKVTPCIELSLVDSVLDKYAKANSESDSWVSMIEMMKKEIHYNLVKKEGT